MKKRLFVKFICEKCYGDNSSNENFIDFKNGQSIDKNFIENEYNKYLDLQNKIDDFIEENDLDDTNDNDIKKVEQAIPECKEFIMYNQAVLIDFKNYVVKVIENEILKNK